MGRLLGTTAGKDLERSERVDEVTGVVERAAFLGQTGQQIFSVTSLPSGPVRGAVVIAPSLLTDRVRLYRGEVLAARRLAAQGFAVLRFDYRGFGHSDGETGVADVARLSADLSVAIDAVRSKAGEIDLTLVGSRFGSLLVANWGGEANRTVLWDPVLTGREYFKTAFRAHMVGRLQRSGDDSAPTSQLQETGRATVLGYTVSRDLVEDVEGLSLEEAKLAAREVLWIESADEMSAPRCRVEASLRSGGVELAVRLIPNDDPGWFVGVRPFENTAAVDALVEWLSKDQRS